MSSDHDLALATLPSDIIRRIITVGQKYINNARLVSFFSYFIIINISLLLFFVDLLSLERIIDRASESTLKSTVVEVLYVESVLIYKQIERSYSHRI